MTDVMMSLVGYALFFPIRVLSKPKFSGVEKIKTIGSTYVAATGLNATPEHAQVIQSTILQQNNP